MCHDLILFPGAFAAPSLKTCEEFNRLMKNTCPAPFRAERGMCRFAPREGGHSRPPHSGHLNPLKRCRVTTDNPLDLDVADLYGRKVLPVAALNLVLIGSLVFQYGHLFGSALLYDLPGHGSLLGFGARKHLLVPMDSQHVAKTHLFTNFAFHPLDADGVAGRDTILLPPGQDHGVHLSSKRPISGSKWLETNSDYTGHFQQSSTRVFACVPAAHPG